MNVLRHNHTKQYKNNQINQTTVTVTATVTSTVTATVTSTVTATGTPITLPKVQWKYLLLPLVPYS